MSSQIQNYIHQTVRKDGKIHYDASVKQWVGILHHESGSIYSQKKTKTAVTKELEEILEEFLVRFFQEKTGRKQSPRHRAKAHHTQVPRTHLQA